MEWFVKVISEFLRTYEFWATLIGVYTAFMLSYWYDRQIKHKEEAQNRIKAMRTIKAELRGNFEHIDVKDKTLMVQFSTVAMDSAISSGRFVLLDVELQNEVVKVYRNFKYAEMYVSKVLQMYGSVDLGTEEGRKSFELFKKLLGEVIGSLRDQIPQAIKLLEEKI